MLALLGLLAAAAVVNAAPSCDQPFQCEYHYQTDTDLWYWNFNDLCSTPGYTVTQQGRPGTNFSFNICGLSPEPCLPPDGNKYIPIYGIAVQNSGDVCALAGEGAPIFNVLDTGNPETGGISITHHAAPIEYNDARKCAPVNGVEVNRKITYNFTCDPNTLFAPAPAVEDPECTYTVPIISKYGCGKVYDGPDSQAAANKEAAERGAEAGDVIGFMILGAVLFVGGWCGIHYYNHRELPFSIPFIGNLSRGGSAVQTSGAGGFSGSAGSGFGSAGASGAYSST